MSTAITPPPFFSDACYTITDWDNWGVPGTVDTDETVQLGTEVPGKGFFERCKHSFERSLGITHNTNLIALHKRLKALESQLQEPTNPELLRLQKEIHNKGIRGANLLMARLVTFSDCFAQETNYNNTVGPTLIKIINTVRYFFNYPPLIAPYTYEPINIRLFEDKAVQPAMQPTPTELKATKYCPVMHNGTSVSIPTLTSENMQKLELKLLDRIAFSLDKYYFILTYDDATAAFSLSQFSIAGPPTLCSELAALFFTPAPPQCDPMRVLDETHKGAQKKSYEIPSVATPIFTASWLGLGSTQNIHSYLHTHACLNLMANHTYTLSLPSGNLMFAMHVQLSEAPSLKERPKA